MKKYLNGFTLVEIIIAFAIFSVIMGLVLISLVGSFRTFNTTQQVSQREEKQRVLFFWLSKEVSSLLKSSQGGSFSGKDKEIFFVYARPENLAEARYVCDNAKGVLEAYNEEPTDFAPATYKSQFVRLEGLEDCRFSYSNGSTWVDNWDGGKEGLPKTIKVVFKYRDENVTREITTDVPVSR